MSAGRMSSIRVTLALALVLASTAGLGTALAQGSAPMTLDVVARVSGRFASSIHATYSRRWLGVSAS